MPIDYIYTSQGKYDYFGFTENHDNSGDKDIAKEMNYYQSNLTSQDYALLPKVIACTNKVRGGQNYKILTRLSPIGLDNIGRPGNVLAHHLMIASDDQKKCKAGPAWLLKRRAWFDRWEHSERQAWPVSTIEENNYLKIAEPPTWQKYFPYTWNAKIEALIDTLDDPKKDIIFLFGKNPHSTDILLDLFYEALSWVPEEKRWLATFCTYTLNKHKSQSIEWQWMGIDKEDKASLGIYKTKSTEVYELGEVVNG